MPRPSLLISLLLLLAVCVALPSCDASAAGNDDLPPVRTEVTYQKGERAADDPEEVWDEWDESGDASHKFPRRQREIKEGMNINTILGQAMKQPKVVTAVLTPSAGGTQDAGQRVTLKFKNQLAAAGIGCRLWFVLEKGRQVVANCDTILDAHMTKDYMIRQPEIMRTVLDNVPFTPKPDPDDEDDDDDEDEKKEL